MWTYETSGIILSSPTLAIKSVISSGAKYFANKESDNSGLNNLVIIGSLDKSVYALDSVDGKVMWEFATGGPVRGSPIVCADETSSRLVHVPSDDGWLYTLHTSTGVLHWKFDTSCTSLSTTPVCGASGKVFVGCFTSSGLSTFNTGTVLALRSARGD